MFREKSKNACLMIFCKLLLELVLECVFEFLS